MRVKEVNIATIIIYDGNGFDHEQASAIDDELLQLRPDFYQYNFPHSFLVFIKSTVKNRKRLALFLNKIKTMVDLDKRFSQVKIGQWSDRVGCLMTFSGRLKSIPLGRMIYLAFKDAGL